MSLATQLSLLFTLLCGLTAFAGSKSIPFTYENRVPFVQVRSLDPNQTPMCFILDTASSPTAIESTTAGQLKLGYRSPEPVGELETGTTFGLGKAPSSFVQGLSATCGGFALRRYAIRTDLSNVSRRCGRRVDGLLGTDFLINKILTINMASRTLRVEPAPGTDNLPTRIMDGIPASRTNMVFVNIATPSAKRPLVFLVDTGTTNSVIDLKAAKRINLALGAENIVNVPGGTKAAYTAEHFVGSFDGHPLPSKIFAVDLSQLSWSLGRQIDGIMGMNFMENHTVQINFHTRQMQLLPSRATDSRVAAR